MKRAILIISVLIGPISLNAQNLTMDQLLEIKKKDIGSAEDYLAANGWEFMEESEPYWDKLGSVVYAFAMDYTIQRAESVLFYVYNDITSEIRIVVQVREKEKYSEYVKAIMDYDCEMVSSKVENNESVKLYQGAITTFMIRSGSSGNYFNEHSDVWTFSIFSNDDYDQNYGIDY
jgi:hypothetical protein